MTRQLAVVQPAAKPLASVKAPEAFSGQADAARLTTPAGLQACITALGEPSAVPLLVDLATYDGKPAAVHRAARRLQRAARSGSSSPSCTTGADGTWPTTLLP